MTVPDDVRTQYDPSKEISESFWSVVSEAQADPDKFKKLTDEELVTFANNMLALKTYFSHDPFYPPDDVLVSENSLDEGGAWVISQGKDYFFRVWDNPELFWDIMRTTQYHQGHRFEFAADREWRERHGTDIPTI